jgi:hypothetical protein
MNTEYGAAGGMEVDGGNRSTRRKTAPVPINAPQISHGLTYDRTRAAAVGIIIIIIVVVVVVVASVRSNLENASVAWNNLTLADSNKLENIQRKFANLCYNRFIQFNFSCNYELMLNYLHLKTFYSRRQHLDALFLVNVFKNKINCCSIMDTVGLHIPAMQIRDFSTFRVKNVLRLSPSTRCVIAVNSVCRSLDIFNKNSISLKDTFSMRS